MATRPTIDSGRGPARPRTCSADVPCDTDLPAPRLDATGGAGLGPAAIGLRAEAAADALPMLEFRRVSARPVRPRSARNSLISRSRKRGSSYRRLKRGQWHRGWPRCSVRASALPIGRVTFGLFAALHERRHAAGRWRVQGPVVKIVHLLGWYFPTASAAPRCQSGALSTSARGRSAGAGGHASRCPGTAPEHHRRAQVPVFQARHAPELRETGRITASPTASPNSSARFFADRRLTSSTCSFMTGVGLGNSRSPSPGDPRDCDVPSPALGFMCRTGELMQWELSRATGW